ncbi:phage tail protein, partial [Tabrizicola fusiformis]|uniref:phage tail protein n=1 Tax=Tabrizicola sp. SY72 TaxID=2741673 RepID=UPI0018853DD3
MRWYLALWLTLSLATPAEAGPLATAIGGLITAVKGFAAINALTGWLVKTVASIALSRLAMALRGTPRQPGIKTEMTTTGGTTPQRIMLGRYATGGQLIAPPMSYGSAGKTPRAWLVYTIALSVVPGCTLARVVINDDYVALGTADPSWGRPVTGDLAGYAWIDFRDGTQTVAHADLLAAFAADPDRPWASDMIGPGTVYAVCRFKYDRERFNGLPALRFEILGIPLYDPRADSTVGGSGAQRWSDPATWAQSENPVVMIYNILRGIDVGAGMIWGGECGADDLPLANWFAAMTECDVPVTLDGGGTEAQYRAGIEIDLDMEPAGVIEELLKTCSGALVEVGGIWKIRVGAPALPSYFLTDEDVIASQAQEFAPFPGLADTYNGITATYPEPASLWEAKDAPPRFDAGWEAEDGGRRLVANLSLPACPHGMQVQRLMTSAIADHRRMRSHRLVLPPEAAVLEPLETVGWTSTRWGYSAKTFEITSLTDSLMSMLQGLSLRERDAADFAWDAGDEIAVDLPATATSAIAAQTVPGFAVAAVALADGAAADRRPAIEVTWDADGADDATGLQWEVRPAGAAGVQMEGTYGAVRSGRLTLSGSILPGETYEVRARMIVDRATDWTDWEAVTTDDILLGRVDVNGT